MNADEKVFNDRAKEIAALNGISEELARKYLSLVGDTPSLVRWDGDFAIVAVYEETEDGESDGVQKGRKLAEIRLPINKN